MPGFFSIIDYDLSNRTLNKRIFKDSLTFQSEEFKTTIFSDSLKKFESDKLFFHDDDFIIVLEGVIFNQKKLILNYKRGNWVETVKYLYQNRGKDFHLSFRGSYSGCIYDKVKNEWIVFTDPIGDKQVFIYKDSNTILLGSEIKHFLSFFKQHRLSVSLDETAAYMLLSYGFFLEEYTLFKEIRKLKAGHYYLIKDKEVKTTSYHKLSNKVDSSLKDKRDIVEQIDVKFRVAVQRQFDKDKEYGYKHIVGLSGGLDSRMTTWVAHEMGYTEILNLTFSQSDYLDETVAKKIASDLKHEWIFKALDNGSFLEKQLEPILDINYGGALYYGAAQGKSLYDLLDFSQRGILHSGQLGDVVVGSFYKNIKQIDKPATYLAGAHSKTLINKINEPMSRILNKYENTELFEFYSRGFTGANQGLLAIQQKTETFSPFYDLDFLEFCLSIPLEYRIGHSIYKSWLKEKYPKAAEYVWENIGTSILSPSIKFNGKRFYLPQIKEAIKYKLKPVLGDRVLAIHSKHHMNPLDYWYRTNRNLQDFMDNYYKEHLSLLNDFPELKNDLAVLYTKGNTIEKCQALTLVGSFKKFLSE